MAAKKLTYLRGVIAVLVVSLVVLVGLFVHRAVKENRVPDNPNNSVGLSQSEPSSNSDESENTVVPISAYVPVALPQSSPTKASVPIALPGSSSITTFAPAPIPTQPPTNPRDNLFTFEPIAPVSTPTLSEPIPTRPVEPPTNPLDNLFTFERSTDCTSDIGNVISPNGKLTRGQTLCSPDQRYKLTITDDTGSLYLLVDNDDGENLIAWDSEITDIDYLRVQIDGNLVARGGSNEEVLWSAQTADPTVQSTVSLSVLDTGVELQHETKGAIWCIDQRGLGCVTLTSILPEARAMNGDLNIVVLSVFSADCAIIVFPTGRVMMIDSATEQEFAASVAPFLHRHNIDHLDYYVETHPDQDHIGGRQQLKDDGLWDEDTLYWNYTSFEYEDSFELEGTQWFIYNAEDASRYGTDLNANSLSFRMEYEGFIYTAGGDEDTESQERFLSDYPELVPAHVCNTAHHLWGPISQDFLVATDPKLFIISTSRDVRDYSDAFKTEFLNAIGILELVSSRYKEYAITAEVGNIHVQVFKKNDWNYSFFY